MTVLFLKGIGKFCIDSLARRTLFPEVSQSSLKNQMKPSTGLKDSPLVACIHIEFF